MDRDSQRVPSADKTKNLACLQCRSKKVKCDRARPCCSRCVTGDQQCVYTKRKPRRRAKNVHSSPRELLPRTIVESASALIISTSTSDGGDSGYDDEDRILPKEADGRFEVRQDSRALDNGRLFVHDGKHRYINVCKARQVQILEAVLAIGDDTPLLHVPDASTLPTPKKAGSMLLKQARLPVLNFQDMHPRPEHMAQMWTRFKSHVDPLVKLVFKPGIEIMLLQAMEATTALSTASHALLMTIWYAAVTATTPEDCLRLYQTQRDELMARYRAGAEQALLQSNWMTTQQMSVLQAVVLLLVFSSGQDSRHLWTISGVAIGVAQGMGLHKDGAGFNLHPVEIEVRRRLWWVLVISDNRISEDCGLSNHVPAMDTALPSNLEDSVLANCSVSPPPDCTFTESTVTHLKAMRARTVLTIKSAKDAGRPYCSEEVIAMTQHTIDAFTGYNAKLNFSTPLGHFCHLLVRLMTLKLVSIQLQHQDIDDVAKKDINLAHTVEILEIAYRIPECSFELGWHFNCKSIQWHSIAYVLHDLCHRQQSSTVVLQAMQSLRGILDSTASTSANHLAHLHMTEAVLWTKLLDKANIVMDRVASLPDSTESAGYLLEEDTARLDTLDWLSDFDWMGTIFDGFDNWDYA